MQIIEVFITYLFYEYQIFGCLVRVQNIFKLVGCVLKCLQFLHELSLVLNQFIDQSFECFLSLVNRLLLLLKLYFLGVRQAHFIRHPFELTKFKKSVVRNRMCHTYVI